MEMAKFPACLVEVEGVATLLILLEVLEGVLFPLILLVPYI
jgi:hypothetical protein